MTVICFCKECGSDLYERAAWLQPGESIEAASFTALPGVPQPSPGDATRCPFCGAELFARGLVSNVTTAGALSHREGDA